MVKIITQTAAHTKNESFAGVCFYSYFLVSMVTDSLFYYSPYLGINA